MMTSPAAATSTFAATTATSGSGSASTTSPTSSTSSASTLTQSDFLQLLTAQLKYQTPNSPADPTQLASEFAAISTVDGISQLNSSLSSIRSGGAAAQIAQAAALVGKQVAVTGDTLTTNTTGTGTGAFTLAAAAQDVQVSIMNPGGAIAATLDLGAMPAGQQSFSWGGGAANTAYTYGVNATDAAGAGVSATPYSVYTVQGVNVSGATPTLNVQGTAAPLAVSAVQTILGASQ